MTQLSLARMYPRVYLLALLVFSLSSPLLAQVDIAAQLLGTVKDPTAAVVVGAELVARNQQTGVEIRASSDSSGNYIFHSLPPGTYTVSCEMTGFKKFVASDIVLQAQKTTTLSVVLELGATTQSIEVVGTAAMVDTVSPTVQTTYQERIMQAIPVIGRDARSAMELLVPGAVSAGTSQNVPITSFNGVSGFNNNYRVDGSDANDYQHGAATPMPQIENLSEFNVTSSVPDASVGRAAGGQISAILKSGTNKPHGQVWGYFQNAAWNANSWQNNWLGVAKPRFSQQWYGGNAGGPVFIPNLYNGKDKTFFFTSYERTSTSKTVVSTGETISNAERQGDFSNSPDGIPVINGVPTPYIDPANFSALGKTIAGSRGTDIMPAPTSGSVTFTWSPPVTQVIQKFLGKIDHNISPKHRVFGSLWWTKDVAASPDMFFKFGFGSWATHYPNKNLDYSWPTKTQVWTVNDTYAISPSMLNNFIVNITRYLSALDTTTLKNPLVTASDVGIAAVGDVGTPDIQQIGTPRSMGMGIYQGFTNSYHNNFVYLADNFTITRGRHTWKMGFEYRHFRENFMQTWNSGGTLYFDDGRETYGGTGNGIADMMLGLAAEYTQLNTEQINNLYPAREAYVQDTIKLRPRLTMMLGIRWQPYMGVHEANGHMSAFRPGRSSTVFPLAPVGLVAVGDRDVPGNTYGNRWSNVGPRASLAWDIFGNGKAAVRVGYGLMPDFQKLWDFNEFPTVPPYGISYAPPIDSLANLADPYAQYEASTGMTPFPWKVPTAGDPNNAKLNFDLPLNTSTFPTDFNSGQVHEWNATFEFEPIRTYMISVGYVATRATHLEENHNLNWPRFVPGASANTTANINSRRPYFADGFQTITTYNSDFNSMYNSLQVRFTKRYSHGLTFLGNYTLSSTAQEQNGPRYWGDTALDYYSPGVMHRFATAYSYDLPIPAGSSRLSRAFLGGWTLGGTITGSSGQYGNVGDYNCAQFNYGSASCVATFVGGSPYSPNKGQPVLLGGGQIGVAWLDPSKFIRANQILVDGVPTTQSSTGQRLFLGNATTGVFKGPASFMLDASLSKTFRISESVNLNWRIEATNALNHTVLAMPGGTTVRATMTRFGIVSSAMPPRQVQMSARFVF